MSHDPNSLERHVADALVASGVLVRASLAGLLAWSRAHRLAHGGSSLLGGAVARGMIDPASADRLLAGLAPRARTTGRPVDAVATFLAHERFEPSDRGPGRDRHMGRPVDLRIGPPLHAPERESFLREGRVLAQLDHPAIPRLHDIDAHRGRCVLALDVVEGEVLADALAERDPAALLRVFLEVAGGIRAAHAVGIAHTRLGPGRITVGAFGQAWVTGWGFAMATSVASPEVVRALAASPPSSDPAAPAELAPEVASGGKVGTAADVFGLGVILRALLRSKADPTLDAIAGKALAPDPRGRYATVDDLAEDVRRFLDGRAVVAAREGLIRASVRIARHRPLAATLALAVFLLGAVAVTAAIGTAWPRWRSARTVRERAAARAAEATAALSVADDRRVEAAARLASVELMAELDALLDTIVSAPEPGSPEDEGVDPAVRARRRFDAAEGPRWSGLGALGERRVRLTRGRWLLDRGEAALALEDFSAIVDADARAGASPDPEALFGLFRAARRLAGREELTASTLRDLAAIELDLEDPWRTRYAELAALALKVETAEADAAAGRWADAVPAARETRDEVARLRAHYPTLAFIHELAGRAEALTVESKVHDLPLAALKRGFAKSESALFQAAFLDEAELDPRRRLVEGFVARYQPHASWRPVMAWMLRPFLEHALGANDALRVAAIEQIHLTGRTASALPLVEAVFERGGPPAGPLRTRALLAWARTSLRAGVALDHARRDELERLDLSGAVASERGVLLAHHALVSGDAAAGLRRLEEVLPTYFALASGAGYRDGSIDADELRVFYLVSRDLGAALTDPRSDGEAIRRWLARVRGTLPSVSPPIGRLYWAARAGEPAHAELGALAEVRLGTGSLDWYLYKVGRARARLNAGSRAGEGHRDALTAWATLHWHFLPSERFAFEARDVIVETLERSGKDEAARAFAAIDPVDALWVRRVDQHELLSTPSRWRGGGR